MPTRTASDKPLRDKAFIVAKNLKNDWYQKVLVSIAYKFFDKNFSGAKTLGGSVKTEIMPNQQFAKELHKPVNTNQSLKK